MMHSYRELCQARAHGAGMLGKVGSRGGLRAGRGLESCCLVSRPQAALMTQRKKSWCRASGEEG
jgi:hypothetical protein